MSSNISVITSNTADAIDAVVSDVNGLALAHINGDFGGHNQMIVYPVTPFLEPVTNAVISISTLRTEVYNPNTGQTVVLAIPCVVESNGTVAGGPPVILVEPITTQAFDPAFPLPVFFSVQIASQSLPSYQWQKLTNSGFVNVVEGGPNIVAGATSNELLILEPDSTDAGAYQVVVSNSYGSVISTTGSLTTGGF